VLKLAFSLWFAVPAGAAAMTYAPSLESADWQVQQTRFSCRLRQPIPLYGDAVFEARAGGSQRFFLEPKKNPMDAGFASLTAKAPFWNPDLPSMALGPVPVTNGKRPVQLDDELTRQLLKALGAGLALELERPSRGDPEITVRVGLLPVRFRHAYDKYRDCTGKLPTQTRQQLSTAVLVFEREQTELNDETRGKLDPLIRQARDSAKPALVIDAVSSETPRRLENVRLARERATQISEYLTGHGIAQQHIRSNYRGERDTRRQALVTVRLHLPDDEDE